jgi:hypothetical protein
LQHNKQTPYVIIIQGHKRFSLTGEDYPAVIQTGDEQDSVKGILCQGLELKDIKALDCFEGEVCL